MNSKKSPNLKLKELRKKINEIDKKLVSLLDQRAEIAVEIGGLKKKLKQEIFQPEREQGVLENVSKLSQTLDPTHIRSIWKEIISACRNIQGQTAKVSFLGPKGTFTHQAALETFPSAGTQFLEHDTIYEIFESIEKEKSHFGVIPIENSLQGTVRDTLDLLIEKDLKIYGEIELKINQNFLTLKEIELNKIKTIYSHPQAFAQTRNWVKANIPHAQLIKVNSTAEAARKVSELNNTTNAAIGTTLSSELYNLTIKFQNIEDEPSNFTRFLVISKEENPIKRKRNKTSIIFVTKHTPGSLYKVLELFSNANINLLKIESRPRKTGRWEYIFLMDFEGHLKDPKVKKVMGDLDQNVIWYKILGSYPLNG
ncbi:MAG: prephenate dehydratase [Promethearchaeota archaeon]